MLDGNTEGKDANSIAISSILPGALGSITFKNVYG